MNIGFYGHSNCAYRSLDSFLDIVANHYNGKIVNTGCKQGSEERVLFELKKTKKLDLAIIFHCHHSALFIPESERDLHARDLTRERADHLLNVENLDNDFTKFHTPKFKDLFGSTGKLIEVYETYKQFLYHPDLELNRYYGSLLQIDQYLLYKQVKTIHVLADSCAIPEWFKFSGVVDNSIMKLIQQHPQTNPFFVNCITKEANILVANKLIDIIDSL